MNKKILTFIMIGMTFSITPVFSMENLSQDREKHYTITKLQEVNNQLKNERAQVDKICMNWVEQRRLRNPTSFRLGYSMPPDHIIAGPIQRIEVLLTEKTQLEKQLAALEKN